MIRPSVIGASAVGAYAFSALAIGGLAVPAALLSARASAQDGAPAASLSRPPPGALSCAGCHASRPVEGAIVPPVAGRTAADIAAALAAFRSGERPATVMNRIAKGFDARESQAIAVWLEGQTQ